MLPAEGPRWQCGGDSLRSQTRCSQPGPQAFLLLSPLARCFTLARRQPEKVLGQFLGMPGLQGPTPESSLSPPPTQWKLHPLPLFPSHCSYHSPNSTYFVNCTNLMGECIGKKG